MKNILIVYYSRMGHTARMVRTIADELEALGNTVTVMPVSEAFAKAWTGASMISCSAASLLSTALTIRTFTNLFATTARNSTASPMRCSNVTVVAATPFKATVEGNRYMQKFLERSPWRPRDLKCFAGKIDYPHLNLFDKKCIQLIMNDHKRPDRPVYVTLTY